MSSSNHFPGVGKAVGRSDNSAEADAAHFSSSSRSSSTGRGGGSSSRDNTPIIARYAILSAAAGAVAAGTVVEGRGVTSSVAVGSAALLLDGGAGGEPRTSTPARLSRVLTPLKGQGRRLTHALAGSITTLADLQAREEQQRQQEEAAAAAAAQRRIERRSRRKMRRWANDRLLGVAQVCSLHGGGLGGDEDGATAVAEGEYGPFLDGSHPSKFSTLMAAENTELRDRFLAGYGGKRAAGGATRAGGRATPSLLQDAESRFLRLERRLRGLLTQLVGTDAHMGLFLEDVEALLRGFWAGEVVLPLPGGDEEGSKVDGGSDALFRSLARPLYVEKKGALVLPLNNSAFFRLLVHGCCQYYGLRSHSENLPRGSGDAEEVRAVVVAKPSAVLTAAWSASSSMTMCAFIKDHRLNQHLVPKRRGGERCLNEASEEECAVAHAVAPTVLKPVVA